ncbi:MAG: RHS repeat domain-containing protein [Mangrovibacterium sp.]
MNPTTNTQNSFSFEPSPFKGDGGGFPFGEVFIEERNNTWNTPFLFNGKELDEETGLYYYGARYYNPRVSLWYGVDPLAEKYPGVSPYAYCVNNPVMLVDPDGMEVEGVTNKDAKTLRKDIHHVLSNDKFAGVRDLIKVNKNKFEKIDTKALKASLEGIKKLSDDERTYIDMVVNTINSDNKHKIEYVTGSVASDEGSELFKEYNTKLGNEATLFLGLDSEGKLKSSYFNFNEGLNIPTPDGSHSFVKGSLNKYMRSITSGHELFGHGIPSAKGLTPAENNANAIRTDNLIRRMIGVSERDGSKHSGYLEGHIIKPKALPITK